MDLGIAGRKAIVCASSGGIGAACAQALAEAGCDVVINGRNPAKLEATASAIRAASRSNVTIVQADITTSAGQAALFAACPAPDILVNNNAGPPFRDFRELSREQIIEGLTANMIIAIELIQKAIGPMQDRKFGRIVNITSSAVKAPIAGLDLSAGARAGLTTFLAGVARQVAASNVTINHVLPGAIETDRLTSNFVSIAKNRGVTVEAATAERQASIPAKRFGRAEEIGATCAFLCSVQAAYITGQNILVDGGAFPGTF